MESTKEFLKDFNKTYYNKVINLLAPFEQQRKTELLKCNLCKITAILSFILAVLLFISALFLPDGVITLMWLALGFGAMMLFQRKCIEKSFENKIKNEIMPVIFNNINGFDWSKESFISDDDIKKSNLIPNFYDKTVDDNFHGRYKNVNIDICETKIRDRVVYKSRTRNEPSLYFQGVLVKLAPEKKYKGLTLIKPNGAIKPSGLARVHLEDVEFEKQYDVYSNDQIEARFVLTTAFMERFKKIQQTFKASWLLASITEQGILIGLELNKDFFKLAKINHPIQDFEAFKQLALEFVSILELVDTLKLSQNT